MVGNCVKEEFSENYWNALWRWYESGGYSHVAAFLRDFDLTSFDPKAPPKKTSAFRDIVGANCAPEETELADAIDALGNPTVLTLKLIATKAECEFGMWLADRRNRRAIPHRLESCGYVPVRNPTAGDGYWKIENKRMPVYGRKDRTERERLAAAAALTGGVVGVKSVKSVVSHWICYLKCYLPAIELR